MNRTPDDEPPPVVVAVVGPPGVGKTTLMKSLIRRYTKQTLTEIKGPVTVVSGKKRRLTFLECNNDLNSMIDIGKVADLVLLMVDGSFGFEMVCLNLSPSTLWLTLHRNHSNSSTFSNPMDSQKSLES